jgi:hypothetical protein
MRSRTPMQQLAQHDNTLKAVLLLFSRFVRLM